MADKNELDDLHTLLIASMADLEEEKVVSIVKMRIARGDDPFSIVEDCREGLIIVGERYESHDYYLSGLIMAGEIFQEIMKLLDGKIVGHYRGKELGKVLLGTVAGDIHNIGKNTLSMLLTSYGFTVYDLGDNVTPEIFLQQAIAIHPDIIGLSGLLNTSFDSMKETIELIHASDNAAVNRIPIAIGGGAVTEQVCQGVGADHWANDAMVGVRLFTKILEKKK